MLPERLLLLEGAGEGGGSEQAGGWASPALGEHRPCPAAPAWPLLQGAQDPNLHPVQSPRQTGASPLVSVLLAPGVPP